MAYGVSLRPLPYVQPDRLIRIYEANPANGQMTQDVSQGAFQDWREGAPSIESAALYTKARTGFLEGPDQPPITTMGVSPAFFEVLGASPMLGPGFKPEREYTRFTARDAVLSYAAWHRIFGADPQIVGRAVRFADDDDAWRVVGVMPARFAFDQPVDFWQPTDRRSARGADAAGLALRPRDRAAAAWRLDRAGPRGARSRRRA